LRVPLGMRRKEREPPKVAAAAGAKRRLLPLASLTAERVRPPARASSHASMPTTSSGRSRKPSIGEAPDYEHPPADGYVHRERHRLLETRFDRPPWASQ